MTDHTEDADGFCWGCAKKAKQTNEKGKIRLIWQGGDRESTFPYLHTSAHHFRDENPESIRLKGLHDEALIEGHCLGEIKKLLDQEKIEVLRESPPTDSEGGGGQPVVLTITVRDRL